MSGPLLVYGAYGYTGELVARRALERGLAPVLAGRDSEQLVKVARALGCEWRAFPLSDPDALRRGVRGAGAVVHCAGPFSRTARPMAEACLDERVHYLDLTGEIPVFESLLALSPAARNVGVMLLPGAGFDVVPTDCLAAHLVRRLPGAQTITLALSGLDRVSRGTARTMLEGAAAVRGAARARPRPARSTSGSGPSRRSGSPGRTSSPRRARRESATSGRSSSRAPRSGSCSARRRSSRRRSPGLPCARRWPARWRAARRARR